MTFHDKGFRSIATPMGQPATDSSPGETRQIHTFVTNDDRAAVETSGYFNVLWTGARRVKKGDLLDVVYDIDSTPGHRRYVINIVSNVVVLLPAADDLGALPRAVVPTSDGLTTGLILDTDSFVEATSAGANNILCLPKAQPETRGREIMIWVVPSTNCELQTFRGSSDTINNVNCGGGAVEALLTHTQLYIARQHLATGWLLQAFTALGAVATAIVPD
jgi:hypothetical protein